MRQIVIQIDDKNRIEIIEDDLTTGQITVGEVLEMVISFTHIPRLSKWPFYPMKTPDEWEAEARERYERSANSVGDK